MSASLKDQEGEWAHNLISRTHRTNHHKKILSMSSRGLQNNVNKFSLMRRTLEKDMACSSNMRMMECLVAFRPVQRSFTLRLYSHRYSLCKIEYLCNYQQGFQKYPLVNERSNAAASLAYLFSAL